MNNKLRKIAENSAEKILKDRSDVEVIFVCGSHVEGLADPYSDFDIRVVIRDGEEEPEEYEKDDIRVSIQYINLNVFQKSIINYDFSKIRWILQSLVLYDKDNLIPRLRNEVKENLIEFITQCLSTTVNRYRDAQGSYEKSNYKASVISARLAVENVIRALLLSNNRYNLKSRWIFDQIKDTKVLNSYFYDEFLSVLGLYDVNKKNTEEIILKTANLINYVINVLIPNSIPFKSLFQKSIILNYPLINLKDKGSTRNPQIIWVKYPDESVVVYGKAGKKYEFEGIKGIIWQLLDGKRTTDEIAKYVNELYNISLETALKKTIDFIKDLTDKDLLLLNN